MMEDKRITYANICGKEFPLCLTVAAHQKIIDTFGGLTQMANSMDGEVSIQKIAKLAHILMEGGAARVKALAWLEGEEAPAMPAVPEPDMMAQLLDLADTTKLSKKLFEAIRVSRGVTVEVQPEENNTKNADTTQE